MTEENIHNEQQPIPLDQALKDFRLAANLSVDELAQRLNLKASVILNLENNLDKVISDGIYPLIYLRGYLINYSKELKFPDVESYPEFQKLSHPSESVTSLQNTYIFTDKQKLSKKILLLTLLLIAGGGIAVTYFGNTSTDSEGATESESSITQSTSENAVIQLSSSTEKVEETIQEVSKPEVVEEEAEELETEEYVAVPDVVEAVVAPAVEDTKKPLTVAPEVKEVVVEDVVETAAIVTPVIQPEPVVEQAQPIVEGTPLKLLFEEESWAVVTDAKGKRLAFGLYQAGKELDLVGSAPFSLKIGNPTAVVMYYDDQLVENNFVRGKMANFSLPE